MNSNFIEIIQSTTKSQNNCSFFNTQFPICISPFSLLSPPPPSSSLIRSPCSPLNWLAPPMLSARCAAPLERRGTITHPEIPSDPMPTVTRLPYLVCRSPSTEHHLPYPNYHIILSTVHHLPTYRTSSTVPSTLFRLPYPVNRTPTTGCLPYPTCLLPSTVILLPYTIYPIYRIKITVSIPVHIDPLVVQRLLRG